MNKSALLCPAFGSNSTSVNPTVPNPRVFDIDDSPRNISRMKTKIKEAGQNDLAHCDAHRLDVYPQKTSVPISNQVQPIDPGNPVPRGSDPLIVIAPVNLQERHPQVYDNPVFEVTASIRNAKSVKGFRAAVYLMAEECLPFFRLEVE